MLGLFLLLAAVCCCAVPGVDLPETAFDEADLAISPALPAPLRVEEVPPVAVPLADLPRLSFHCADCLASRPTVAPNHRPLHSMQILLCTFLI